MSDFALDDPSFYEDFLVEAQEHFEQIETNFLALEEAPGDLDLLNAIFRSVHTIKGAAGFLGLQKVQALSHIGENVLDDLRKSRMFLSERVMELLFETVDMLKVLVEDVGVQVRKQGVPEDPDPSELIRNLESLKKGGAALATTQASTSTGEFHLPVALAGLDEAGRKAAELALTQGKTVLGIKAELAGRIYGTAFNPFSLFQMVELVGRLLYRQMIPCQPLVDLDSFEPKSFHLDLVMLVEATEPIEEIRKVFGAVTNATLSFHPLGLGSARAAAGTTEEGTPATEDRRKSGRRGSDDKGVADTIRVSQAKLEQFMNIVAELIISKTMISH